MKENSDNDLPLSSCPVPCSTCSSCPLLHLFLLSVSLYSIVGVNRNWSVAFIAVSRCALPKNHATLTLACPSPQHPLSSRSLAGCALQIPLPLPW